MRKDSTIAQVAAAHFALVALLVLSLAASGRPLSGAVLGGGAMGASLLLLWGMVHAVAFEGRRTLLLAAAAAKFFLYLAFVTAVIRGWLAVDAGGFAAGVTCFVGATVVVTALRSSRRGGVGFDGARV
jgi:hypothetical protein